MGGEGIAGEKWCWIELIGFDRDSPDYAVGEFLKKFGGAPAGVSLLFADIGFVLGHRSNGEYAFRPCDCVYGKKNRNEERERQAWTSRDLAELIAQLQARGIKVYLSFFNFAKDNIAGEIDLLPLRERDRFGNYRDSIFVLKHTADGKAFSRTLFPKLRQVVRDFGFDGVQIADGISSARYSVEAGDFSDDIVGRFFAAEGITGLPVRCDGSEEYGVRREKILSRYRLSWTKFLMGLWKEYYADMHRELAGVPLLINSFWTRDPFEAMYRYGIDYRDCIQKGDRLMIEEVSATRRILADEDQGNFYLSLAERDFFHYEFYLMQMSIKCCLPQNRQLTLTPIKDTTEQWDILRHAPMELARAIYRRNNGFVSRNGKLVRYSDGPLYCLSDGVPEENWRYLEGLERMRLDTPDAAEGMTLLWSDTRLDREFEEYGSTRNYTATAIHNALISAGLSVSAMARADELEGLKTPLLIANPGFLSESERDAVRRCGAPVMTVGFGELGGEAVWTAEIGDFSCRLYGGKPPEEDWEKPLRSVLAEFDFSPCEQSAFDAELGIWTYPLRYRRLPKDFFSALSLFANRYFGFPHTDCPKKRCKVTGFRRGEKLFLILSNDDYFYIIPEVKLGRKIRSAKSLVKYDGYEILYDGCTFRDRIPPRGMDLVEIIFDS